MSQITIDGTTLNFKDSAFTGDQWESVADWVLNGGGEESKDYANLSKSYAVGSSGVREGENTDNAKYYKEQTAALNTAAQSSADAAATSAATAAESKTAAAGSAAEAATSAATAGEKASVAAESATAAEDSKTASEASASAAAASKAAAADSASAAAGSATAAQASETNAAAAASKAENASNHPPRIGESGYWELWDFDNGKYVTTTYPAQGPQGVKGNQGEQGLKGDTGETGPQGPKGDKGDTGAAAGFGTPTATVDANVGIPGVEVSASGPDTAKVFQFTFKNMKGEQGVKGDKGDSGDSYTVLGLYGTLLELEAAHPTGSAGQAWFVGTADDNVVYQWDVDKFKWVNVGPLKGPKGDTGAQGPQGVQGIQGEKGDTGAQGPKGDTGPQGPQGVQGIQGEKGEQGATGATGPTGPTGPEGPEGPQGPQGETGPQGEQGIQGPQGEAGESAYTAASKGGYTGTETQFNSDLAKIGNKADKSEMVTATLLSTGWTGDAAPYSYVLTVSGVTATSNQEVLPALNITAEQLEALQSANIQDGGQAANSMTLKAYGDKPTIDLHIRVIKRGD